jgi:hypothetical protein
LFLAAKNAFSDAHYSEAIEMILKSFSTGFDKNMKQACELLIESYEKLEDWDSAAIWLQYLS